MTSVLEIQGRGRTVFCRPVLSFPQVARQVGMKDEDGLRFAVPSRPRLLAVPSPGPMRAPDGCEHCLSLQSRIFACGSTTRRSPLRCLGNSSETDGSDSGMSPDITIYRFDVRYLKR